MAIITNEIDARGHLFENQYIRVDRVEATKSGGTMNVHFGVYWSQQSAQDGEPPHRAHTVEASFDLYSQSNLWQQAYVAVKGRYPVHTDV